MKLTLLLITLLLALSCSQSGDSGSKKFGEGLKLKPYPVAFVASVPVVSLKSHLNAFGNHGTEITDSIPGGDLYIMYPSGKLKNITREAGFGIPAGEIQQGERAIAVRQPNVHFSGEKILFSMMVGGPRERFDRAAYRRWQIYEASNIGENEVPVITKISPQPEEYNNISPIYAANDDILFASDAPLFGMKHTYPQLDEYESMPTTTGIYKIDFRRNRVVMIQHAPSGLFDLQLDSFGRILFTKWDHLKRDQQADADRYEGGTYRAFDFPSEAESAERTAFPQTNERGQRIADSRGVLYDVFPEARSNRDPTKDPNESIQNFKQFFIWMINPDGSNEETINHVGRHEFGGVYMPPIFKNDPNLSEFLPDNGVNKKIRDTFSGNAGLFQISESPLERGKYLATFAQEFQREAAGRIVEFSLPPGANPDDVVMKEYTQPTLDDFETVTQRKLPGMTGHYRNPTRLSDGTLLVAHTPEYRPNLDESTDPGTTRPRFIFQLKKMVARKNGEYIAGGTLTSGIVKHIRFWTDAETPKEYFGPLNETDPVEVRPRPRPKLLKSEIDPIELAVIREEGINPDELVNYLKQKNLALIVSRNVTLRDQADVSQPFNLRVPGGVETRPLAGKVYDISHLQIFQGELTRSYQRQNGRRVYSRLVRNTDNHPDIEKFFKDNAGVVKLGADGSMAAIVPANRALSWQLVSPDNKPVVRERVWVSFAPGEIRTCASCHGINRESHQGFGEPTNKPDALRELLKHFKIVAP